MALSVTCRLCINQEIFCGNRFLDFSTAKAPQKTKESKTRLLCRGVVGEAIAAEASGDVTMEEDKKGIKSNSDPILEIEK